MQRANVCIILCSKLKAQYSICILHIYSICLSNATRDFFSTIEWAKRKRKGEKNEKGPAFSSSSSCIFFELLTFPHGNRQTEKERERERRKRRQKEEDRIHILCIYK